MENKIETAIIGYIGIVRHLWVFGVLHFASGRKMFSQHLLDIKEHHRGSQHVTCPLVPSQSRTYMSHSLNSLKGGYIGDYIGDYYRGY